MKNDTRSYIDKQLDRAGIFDGTTRKQMKDLSAGVIHDAIQPDGYGVVFVFDGPNSHVRPRTREEARGATLRTIKRTVENHEAREYNQKCGTMRDGFMVYED